MVARKPSHCQDRCSDSACIDIGVDAAVVAVAVADGDGDAAVADVGLPIPLGNPLSVYWSERLGASNAHIVLASRSAGNTHTAHKCVLGFI